MRLLRPSRPLLALHSPVPLLQPFRPPAVPEPRTNFVRPGIVFGQSSQPHLGAYAQAVYTAEGNLSTFRYYPPGTYDGIERGAGGITVIPPGYKDQKWEEESLPNRDDIRRELHRALFGVPFSQDGKKVSTHRDKIYVSAEGKSISLTGFVFDPPVKEDKFERTVELRSGKCVYVIRDPENMPTEKPAPPVRTGVWEFDRDEVLKTPDESHTVFFSREFKKRWENSPMRLKEILVELKEKEDAELEMRERVEWADKEVEVEFQRLMDERDKWCRYGRMSNASGKPKSKANSDEEK
ncbi:hypothetical protein T439DRAFT_358652 [Meredithblackwellia eburnea MCA 4105]